MEIVKMFAITCAVIAAYFLPYIIAISNKSERRTQIGLLNLTLGWTVIGWIIFLVMAVGKNKPK